MTYETILVETNARGTNGVTLLTINRPQALNALNSKVLEELIHAFAAYQADGSQLCAILTGSGDKAFAAGADIKEMADKPAADFYLDDFFDARAQNLDDYIFEAEISSKPWGEFCAVCLTQRCGSNRLWVD